MFEKIRLVLIFLFGLLLRWCVTYHSYSGQGKAPMFGDYEAQRHWQEITFNLPYKEWYSNSTRNDLQYWGLDYPPLTAYHSLLLGYVANKTNPDFVALGRSRGFESDEHKFFMRLSVVVADILIYIPAIFYFASKLRENSKPKTNVFQLDDGNLILISMIIYPGLILIDHGHFQYNCVSLGLFVAAVTLILNERVLLASGFFTLALNYKQMELYHALPFFFYILGSNVSFKRRSIGLKNLFKVAFVVLATFAIVWSPFLNDVETLRDVVHRLFPFSRGIFEDKVANVWCAVNVVYKLRKAFGDLELAKICLVATLVSVLPSNLDLFFRPRKEKLVISLVNTSLAFFLFSFQVHEKSILLVAIPVLLHTRDDPFASFWFLIISNFSMSHLYVKDHLVIAYLALTTFYILSVWLMFGDLLSTNRKPKDNRYSHLVVALFYLSMVGTAILTLGLLSVEPPKKYPDLFPVLISLYSCAHFVMFFIYFNYRQFRGDYSKIKSN